MERVSSSKKLVRMECERADKPSSMKERERCSDATKHAMASRGQGVISENREVNMIVRERNE